VTLAPVSAVVVDTMVVSWLFDERANPLGERYRQIIEPARVILSFQSVMELRFGALRAGWGEFRRRRLERDIAELTVVQPDDRMLFQCAQLRLECQRIGHGLADKVHDGDRWIGATAIRLGCPLVSHDGVFKDAPGLTLITLLESYG